MQHSFLALFHPYCFRFGYFNRTRLISLVDILKAILRGVMINRPTTLPEWISALRQVIMVRCTRPITVRAQNWKMNEPMYTDF